MTPFRSIAVQVDLSPCSAGRLLTAIDLARRFEAALTAIFAVGVGDDVAEFAHSAYAAAPYAAAELVADRHADALRVLRHHAEHHAKAACPDRVAGASDDTRRDDRIAPHGCIDDAGSAGRPSLGERREAGEVEVRWLELLGADVERRVVAELPYVDLAVLGRPGAGGPGSGIAGARLVEAIVLGGGRPALLLPDARPRESIGRRVLVAWDGGAQSARALTAALPFLRRAEQVGVAAWAPAGLAAPSSGVDVAGYLRRHGIDATPETHPHVGDVGKAIARRAGELDADLIVMGCYGHARLHERVFGGATRRMLAELTRPVLMSH